MPPKKRKAPASKDKATKYRVAPKHTPRFRPIHKDSEGESESEDRDIVYRALRDNEDPINKGIVSDEGYDEGYTAKQHVSAKSRTSARSPYISTTRSKGVAGRWSTETTQGKKGVGKVARIKLSPNDARHDFTTKEGRKEVFSKKEKTSKNAAKGSQEVLIDGRKTKINPDMITGIYDVKKMENTEYSKAKSENIPKSISYKKTRKLRDDKPQPLVFNYRPNISHKGHDSQQQQPIPGRYPYPAGEWPKGASNLTQPDIDNKYSSESSSSHSSQEKKRGGRVKLISKTKMNVRQRLTRELMGD